MAARRTAPTARTAVRNAFAQARSLSRGAGRLTASLFAKAVASGRLCTRFTGLSAGRGRIVGGAAIATFVGARWALAATALAGGTFRAVRIATTLIRPEAGIAASRRAVGTRTDVRATDSSRAVFVQRTAEVARTRVGVCGGIPDGRVRKRRSVRTHHRIRTHRRVRSHDRRVRDRDGRVVRTSALSRVVVTGLCRCVHRRVAPLGHAPVVVASANRQEARRQESPFSHATPLTPSQQR